MPRKSTAEKPLKTDTKSFLRLMQKRDTIQRAIARQQRKLSKVDSQLAQFAEWLTTLTAAK